MRTKSCSIDFVFDDAREILRRSVALNSMLVAAISLVACVSAGESGKADVATTQNPARAIEARAGVRITSNITQGSCGILGGTLYDRVGIISLASDDTRAAAAFGNNGRDGITDVLGVRRFSITGSDFGIQEDGNASVDELCASGITDAQWNGVADNSNRATAFSSRLFHALGAHIGGDTLHFPQTDSDTPALPGNVEAGPLSVLDTIMNTSASTDESARSNLREVSALALGMVTYANDFFTSGGDADEELLALVHAQADVVSPDWTCGHTEHVSRLICSPLKHKDGYHESCEDMTSSLLMTECGVRNPPAAVVGNDHPLIQSIPSGASSQFRNDIRQIAAFTDATALSGYLERANIPSKLDCGFMGCAFDVGDGTVLKIAKYAYFVEGGSRRQLEAQAHGLLAVANAGYQAASLVSAIQTLRISNDESFAFAYFTKVPGITVQHAARDAALPPRVLDQIIIENLEEAVEAIQRTGEVVDLDENYMLDGDISQLMARVHTLSGARSWQVEHAQAKKLESFGVRDVDHFMATVRERYSSRAVNVTALQTALGSTFQGTPTQLKSARDYLLSIVKLSAGDSDATLTRLAKKHCFFFDPAHGSF